MNTVERILARLVTNRRTGCHEWFGALDSSGYGIVRLCGKLYKVHRLAYEHAYGKVPDNLLVLHSCDNRRCANPKHLFPGTHLDNARDRDQKGRGVIPQHYGKGENHPFSKLTAINVQTIRKLHKQGVALPLIARIYQVSLPTIYDVVKNRRWKWL